MAVIEDGKGACACCGAPATGLILCPCHAYEDWHANAKHDMKCGFHKWQLYEVPERTTIAMGIPALETHDRYRNFR